MESKKGNSLLNPSRPATYRYIVRLHVLDPKIQHMDSGLKRLAGGSLHGKRSNRRLGRQLWTIG
jgi:hypothetical protein